MATRTSCVVLLGCLVVCAACDGGPGTFLGERDRDINNYTQALAAAGDDRQRAQAYSARGVAYSEKARYSRIEKLIADDEYLRLFDLAISDHDRAIALDPLNPELLVKRGQTYYDRGSGDLVYDTNPYDSGPRNDSWLAAAAADFEKATQKDANNAHAFDMLGLAYESNREADKAIQAYTTEMTLDTRLGRLRLADAYCVLGYRQQLQKQFVAAAASYRKSVEFGTADDKSCPVQPAAAAAALDAAKPGL